MKTCLITCGPASTRIDQVRRITNFSTGELGTLLTESLAAAGHRAICLRGEGATFRGPKLGTCETFFSNPDLLKLLKSYSQDGSATHIFHAAALTDFEVLLTTDGLGNALSENKIPSLVEELVIKLRPAEKVIRQLRALFPKAIITGWKYELEGTRDEVLAKALAQLEANQTDACVVNGSAYGDGFGWITQTDNRHFSDKAALVAFLGNY